MDRQEFINRLRRSLSDVEDYEYINDTVNYYENYIDSEIRKGENEEAVLRMLGDPGLIAKSIKASRGEVGTTAGTATSEYEEQENNKFYGDGWLGKFLSLPGWAIKLTIGTVAILFFVLLIMLINWMLPVIVIGAVAYMFYRFVKDNFFK